MIIGIDISSIPYGTGVSNYTLNLVRHLLAIDKTNTYKLFFSSLRLPLPGEISRLAKKYRRLQVFHYRLPPTLLHWLWNRLHLVPIEKFIGPCHVFHTSDWTQPPTLCPNLTTVHDLSPFIDPSWHHPRVVATHRLKLSLASRFSRHFICVSQNTSSDLKRFLPIIPNKKISVIYEAAEDKYSEFNKLSPETQQSKIAHVKKIYDLDNFILAQGTREPRKNLPRLVDAFLRFKKLHPTSRLQLAIAGKYGWGSDVSPPDPSIKILGFIPEKDMVPLHAAAFCLAYPSLYEGFGLPLVKAMKLGLPIITSHNSSLPEICGSAAVFVDPENVDDLAKAIDRLYRSVSLRQSLSHRGLLRSKIFSWTVTARQTLQIYQLLATKC